MKKKVKSKKRLVVDHRETSAGSVAWSSLDAKVSMLTDTSMRVSDEESQMILAYHLTLAALLMSQFSTPQADAVAARVGRFLDGDVDCAEAEASRAFVKHLDHYYERLAKEDEE